MISRWLLFVCLFPTIGFSQTLVSKDIGAVAAAGSTGVANGVYTVRASGADVWNNADEFRFVYASLSGDGEITARVDSLAAVDPWSKAGVMIRETLAANSRYAYAVLAGSNGMSLQYRQATGGTAAYPGIADAAAHAPYWLRLRRVGNVFTAFGSTNGSTWTQRGSITVQMGATAFVGLAVTSHLDGTLATGVFSNVTLPSATAPPPPPPPPPPDTTTFTSNDIGAVAAAGSTSLTNGVYTMRASGADIWGTADEFRFAYQGLTGDGEMTVRVDSLAVADPWSKAGIMIRETLAANSRYAFVLVSGTNGAGLQIRQATGGSADYGGAFVSSARAPYWLRLRRAGNVFTAYLSSNGTTWTQSGSVTIQMTSAAYIGLAVTSHLDGAIATAGFSNVTVGGVQPPPPPPSSTGSALLTWVAPTTYTNGAPLTGLVGFKVRWGTQPGTYSSQLAINNPTTTSWTLGNLAGGRTWYFVVTALDVGGLESAFSNEANKTLP